MSTTATGHRSLVVALALALPLAASAGVIETKSLTRTGEAVVLNGTAAPGYYGLTINNADATLSPNKIFAWAYDSATGWRQVVFQIDEVNNARPLSPPPTCTGGYNIGSGPNHMEADDGLWDANDELVFMCEESGDRVTQDLWAPGAVTTSPRYEIALVDPLDSSKKGWVYLFQHDTVPTWRTDDYVSWNETTNTVSALNYGVDYPDSHTNALYFSNLNVTAAGGGTGANLVQKSKWYWYGGFALSCGASETGIRTEQTITGGSCGTMVLPWYAKDGRVRVLRYFIWTPYCTWVTNGIGMWPDQHYYYYKSYWQEDHNDMYHGGSGHTDYWWHTVNHANTTAMTFYDSNGETCAINGTAETLANTPLWTWNQVSSSYGSYVKVFRDTAKLVSPDSRRNLYTDSGTGQRGDAGYRIENPTESTEGAWDHFYYFLLPANAPNQGAAYNARVDNPLGSASLTQTYDTAPPQDFLGILSAIDEGGACQNLGVRVTWDNQLTWNDGCTSGCNNRRFEVTRNGVLVQTVADVALDAWVDTTGDDGVSYSYGVEACNQGDSCSTAGTVLSATDFVASAPDVPTPDTVAADVSGCSGDGVVVTWTGPSGWNDNGEGVRRFDLYWSTDAYASPVATGITSPSIFDAPDGADSQYRVRAVNGCGIGTDYSASTTVADGVGTPPMPPADPSLQAADVEACSLSGVSVAWNPLVFWGDNGQGTRRYDLFWSGDGYTVPLVAGATSPVVAHPPNDSPYTYRVVATNGCGIPFVYGEAAATDVQTAAAFAGVQSVTDTNLCAASNLTITWSAVVGDGPSGWNDGGVGAGTRHFEVYRSGTLVSTVGETVTSATHRPPATKTSYDFTVRAVNRQGCYTAGGASLPGTDAVTAVPTASPGLTVASDTTCESGSGVTLTWDPVTDWGDGGQGAASRAYRVYISADNYASPVAVVGGGVTTTTYNAPDNIPYRYRIQARNGCGTGRNYTTSAAVIDKTSCSPPCTPILDNSFESTSDFALSCHGGQSLWSLTPGVGRDGTRAWRFVAPAGTGEVFFTSVDVPKTGQSLTSTLATTTPSAVLTASASWNVSCPHGDPTHYSVEIQGPAGGAFTVLKAMGSATDPMGADVTTLYNAAGQGAGTYTLRVVHSSAGSPPKEATLSAWSLAVDDGNNPFDATAAIEMSSPVILPWTTDVKLRFWSSVDLSADDAGVVELWTNNNTNWRKVENMLYPEQLANVPASIGNVCPSNVVSGPQPGFQGSHTGVYYQARLDGLLTTATNQIKVRFQAATGGTAGPSTWTVDDVKLGYGITDLVYFWSLEGDLSLGAVREATGSEALLSWEDGTVYSVQEFRIYRSANPAAIRTDATTALVRTQPDTDATSYTFTTSDGAPPEGACWYYKVYGYKEPCGESNEGEN